MGCGASSQPVEAPKPAVAQPAAKSQLPAPMADIKAVWVEQFGVLGRFSAKDVALAVAFLKQEGQDQMGDINEKSPAWTVLGASHAQPEKSSWIAYFENYDAYFTHHKNAQNMEGSTRANVMQAFLEHGLHKNFPENMGGGYMGTICHLENPASGLYMHEGFVALEIINAKDEDAAQKLLALAKTQGTAVMAANPDCCVRITVMGPGGDQTFPEKDPKKLMVVQQWASKEAFTAAVVKRCVPESADAAALISESSSEEFANTESISHYTKPVLTLKEVMGEEESTTPRAVLMLYPDGYFHHFLYHKKGNLTGERTGMYTRAEGKERAFTEGELIQGTYTGGPATKTGNSLCYKITELNNPVQGSMEAEAEEAE